MSKIRTLRGAVIAAATLAMAELTACGGTQKSASTIAQPTVHTPEMIFDADSAYSYVAAQVAMGPRTPRSDAHRQCADYIESTLKRHGVDTVLVQKATAKAFTGENLPLTNIMGRINPDAQSRVLLVAHYDTRPWADNEANDDQRLTPIPGANDGASGVGVMLEVARALQQKRPAIGVDLLFVDLEDYGDGSGLSTRADTWCLGSQHWMNNHPYSGTNRPRFGIVLDMVGGNDARFHREYYSEATATSVVNKVWGMAARSGYGDVFVNEPGGAIVDDHLYVSRVGIPCIDIVESNNRSTHSFPPTWHTLSDDMASISKTTLGAVGQTVLNVIYTEK